MNSNASAGFLVAFFSITLAGSVTLRAAILAGPVTNSANGHIYYLLNPSTWTAAEDEAVSMGGHLATIRNYAENTWVADTFGHYGAQTRALWIGLNDVAAEGTFVWSSEESASYRNWLDGNPNNAGGQENYVNIWWDGWKWNDKSNVSYDGSYPLDGVVEIIPAMPPQPVITSFALNGQLTWTNFPGTNGFAVQWAPAVSGPWATDWNGLDSIVSTGAQTTVAVPMFYRLSQGFTLASARGTWIFGSSPPLPMGNMFFTCSDDGIITESAMFIPQTPQGFFTVQPVSGRVTNTLIFRNGGSFDFAGSFASAEQIVMDPLPGMVPTNFPASRLDAPSRCAGTWSGTLHPTNNLSDADHPVSFSVDSRGLVTGFTGFAGNPIGRFYALSNGVAVGFVYTGENYSTNPYNQVRISGDLSGNSFHGVYHLDEGINPARGTVTLTRP